MRLLLAKILAAFSSLLLLLLAALFAWLLNRPWLPQLGRPLQLQAIASPTTKTDGNREAHASLSINPRTPTSQMPATRAKTRQK